MVDKLGEHMEASEEPGDYDELIAFTAQLIERTYPAALAADRYSRDVKRVNARFHKYFIELYDCLVGIMDYLEVYGGLS